MTDATTAAPQTIVQLVEGRKSTALAIVLTIAFGPLGLLYTSVLWGVVMCIITFIIGLFTLGFGGLLMWPIVVVMAAIMAPMHNRKLQRKMERMAAR